MARHCGSACLIGVIRQNLDALSGECHSVSWTPNQVTLVAAVVGVALTVGYETGAALLAQRERVTD